ncbi:TonB-dependent siderophore receptor [Brasilonema sp. UFV-L1]|uniref:TonB-dependent siderophore receptor n=1 Tax=Brasilonema sp. UFV-L1 TaxID=2234130 RepID=UPI00145D6BE8|nr:TonB-dependent siderophore receptor [Brasilonema sp. UFV-L1]NMG06822.1 TonB-dependent siderophore receptor [Brasilonema sp. UFV-L1]
MKSAVKAGSTDEFSLLIGVRNNLKKVQLFSSLLTLISGTFLVFLDSAQAQIHQQKSDVQFVPIPSRGDHKNKIPAVRPRSLDTNPLPLNTAGILFPGKCHTQYPITEIKRVSELTPTVTSVLTLLAQEPEKTPTIVQVTAVRIKPTPTGIEVVLETPTVTLQKPITKSENNTLIVDIPNAVLALPDGQAFRSQNPVQGIKVISVTQTNATNIRVSVTGEATVPNAQVISSANGLVLSFTPTNNNNDNSDIELIVTGRTSEYIVPNTATITKNNLFLRNLPFSVQIVPQQVIQDQKALTVSEAVRNVSGFALSGRGGGRNEFSLLTRGFTADQFRDGFSEGNNANRVTTEISNIERIEVLKGPSAVLYGRSEPGGIVNLVTKQPLSVPYYGADLIVGSYDFYRSNLDLTGPIDAKNNLGYRLNLAYENAGSFRDGVESERFFVSPKLSFNLGSKTTLSFFGEYQEDSRPVDFGLVAVGNRVADIPISRFLGDSNRKNDVYQRRGYVFLDHRFSENWSIKSGFRATSSDQYFSAIQARGGVLQPDNRTLNLQAQNSNQFFSTDTFQTNLVGNFFTGSVKHTTLVGFEFGHESRDVETQNANAGSINIFRPMYQFPIGRFTKTIDRNEETNLYGFYLQDEIAFTDNLKLLLGGRFDIVDFDLKDNLTRKKTQTYDSAFSPQVGIVYQPSQTISLYANYSRSFVPQSGSSFEGTPFKAERGTQYEVGVKADWFGGRLSSTLALYEITKTNVLVTDPQRQTYFIQTGEQRSRGVELDVIGQILPGWNVIASYAYTDAIITSDTTFAEGNRLASVPYNSFSLWTTYQILNGGFQGLGFGAGVFVGGDRSGDLNNSFTLPDYARVDAAVYYNRGNLRAAVNIKNLFDTQYFESAQSRTQIFPGAPLTVLGTLSLQF